MFPLNQSITIQFFFNIFNYQIRVIILVLESEWYILHGNTQTPVITKVPALHYWMCPGITESKMWQQTGVHLLKASSVGLYWFCYGKAPFKNPPPSLPICIVEEKPGVQAKIFGTGSAWSHWHTEIRSKWVQLTGSEREHLLNRLCRCQCAVQKPQRQPFSKDPITAMFTTSWRPTARSRKSAKYPKQQNETNS